MAQNGRDSRDPMNTRFPRTGMQRNREKRVLRVIKVKKRRVSVCTTWFSPLPMAHSLLPFPSMPAPAASCLVPEHCGLFLVTGPLHLLSLLPEYMQASVHSLHEAISEHPCSTTDGCLLPKAPKLQPGPEDSTNTKACRTGGS